MKNDREYYLAWSRIFDDGKIKYDIPKIKKAVRRAGATKVYVDKQFGWNNQPDVVCFSFNEHSKQNIYDQLVREFIVVDWFIVGDKSWTTEGHIF